MEPRLCPGCRVLASTTGRPRGRVKWFDLHKGYGFITKADGKDIFVHRSGLAEGVLTLEKEQWVEFEVETKGGRAQAVNVKVVEE
ncbi:MAG: cold-shock protein [Anaerolineae bacterium]